MRMTIRPVLGVFFVVTVLAFTQTAFANPRGAPEIDPGMGLSGLAVLGTAIAIVRGRRKAK